jgi:SAM-dependent methyltransferase
MTSPDIQERVRRYYTGTVTDYGPTPRGVDWNSLEGQLLRFDQLLKLCDRESPYSLIDLGCGYGGLLDHLTSAGDAVRYFGLDLSDAMIREARTLHPQEPPATFEVGAATTQPADYVVASGIFNVKQQTPDEIWADYILKTLEEMARMSTRGFAFNLLTSYSDPKLRRPDLHYADPCRLFDTCKRRFSRHVSLLHDYGLWEFTILVRYAEARPRRPPPSATGSSTQSTPARTDCHQ